MSVTLADVYTLFSKSDRQIFFFSAKNNKKGDLRSCNIKLWIY